VTFISEHRPEESGTRLTGVSSPVDNRIQEKMEDERERLPQAHEHGSSLVESMIQKLDPHPHPHHSTSAMPEQGDRGRPTSADQGIFAIPLQIMSPAHQELQRSVLDILENESLAQQQARTAEAADDSSPTRSTNNAASVEVGMSKAQDDEKALNQLHEARRKQELAELEALRSREIVSKLSSSGRDLNSDDSENTENQLLSESGVQVVENERDSRDTEARTSMMEQTTSAAVVGPVIPGATDTKRSQEFVDGVETLSAQQSAGSLNSQEEFDAVKAVATPHNADSQDASAVAQETTNETSVGTACQELMQETHDAPSIDVGFPPLLVKREIPVERGSMSETSVPRMQDIGAETPDYVTQRLDAEPQKVAHEEQSNDRTATGPVPGTVAHIGLSSAAGPGADPAAVEKRSSQSGTSIASRGDRKAAEKVASTDVAAVRRSASKGQRARSRTLGSEFVDEEEEEQPSASQLSVYDSSPIEESSGTLRTTEQTQSGDSRVGASKADGEATSGLSRHALESEPATRSTDQKSVVKTVPPHAADSTSSTSPPIVSPSTESGVRMHRSLDMRVLCGQNVEQLWRTRERAALHERARTFHSRSVGYAKAAAASLP
ncbi:unnamed protein product, partial [Amoebophrya sp. A25]